MKKTILASLCLGLFGILSYGQGSTSIDVATEKLYMSSDASRPIDAVGSPYVDKNFLPVKVKGFDGQIFTGRYNAYNGEMEINLGTKIIALDSSKDYEVMYTQNNKIYRTFNYSTPNGISKRGFLNVVHENGDNLLLKSEVIKYYDKVPAATSYQTDKPAKFVKEGDVFYLKKGSVITPLPTRKKDLLKAYPKNAKKIKTYLKENKISLKKERDLIRLASYLATL
ncbi:hypothetical protein BTO05_07220 [Winogradskyella sp. PC-19]|uniref:hypothetical protein n=1 Tax=unclassified Winogradskyella TaxID=2615021 RepID=UPI000B3D2216|nr:MULTISPECIES: hypothetical protein [unclassified Winogradskyella]ARV09438.1 hypothetical protein BTO05_07220 [Winogradskyella sp. PC-19]RZN83962.1 MAG: hypothetical protein EVB12_00880 [Winogradskyella sp.]